MAKAHERLAHVFDRVEAAHNTLKRIVDRAEDSDDGDGDSSIQDSINEKLDAIKDLKGSALKDGWGSYPKTMKEKKTFKGQEYVVESYDYSDAGPVQTSVLKELNMLLGRQAQLNLRDEIKKEEEEIPEFVFKHEELLRNVLAEMDKLKSKDEQHPYNVKRTRSS